MWICGTALSTIFGIISIIYISVVCSGNRNNVQQQYCAYLFLPHFNSNTSESLVMEDNGSSKHLIKFPSAQPGGRLKKGKTLTLANMNRFLLLISKLTETLSMCWYLLSGWHCFSVPSENPWTFCPFLWFQSIGSSVSLPFLLSFFFLCRSARWPVSIVSVLGPETERDKLSHES